MMLMMIVLVVCGCCEVTEKGLLVGGLLSRCCLVVGGEGSASSHFMKLQSLLGKRQEMGIACICSFVASYNIHQFTDKDNLIQQTPYGQILYLIIEIK